MMKNVLYKDLIKEYNNFNAWKSIESFPITEIGEQTLSKFEVTEYIFEGMMSNRTPENFGRLILNFKEGVLKLLEGSKMNNFIFAIEHGSSNRTRARTYKGLINRTKVNEHKFAQKEFILSEKESRIAFVAELNRESFEYLSAFLLEYTCSFVIATKREYLTESFLNEVTSVLEMNGWNHINFLNVMLKFCPQGDYVYRIGGNDGEEYWSLQKLSYRFNNTNDLSE